VAADIMRAVYIPDFPKFLKFLGVWFVFSECSQYSLENIFVVFLNGLMRALVSTVALLVAVLYVALNFFKFHEVFVLIPFICSTFRTHCRFSISKNNKNLQEKK
jgi:hypothetical protein